MKRICCLLLALFLCLSAAGTVRADVIFEPEDDFYENNRDACQYHNRTYYAQGPDGGVTVYRSPESAAVDQRLENGQPLWIGYIYTDADGIEWGYTEQFNGLWEGWVPMDYLLLKYDHLSFSEEFADRILDTSGEITASGDEVRFWNYPGSEDFVSVPVDEGYPVAYQKLFADDAGREWGYIGYHMGIKSVWVCLDAPGADYDTLYADHAPQQVTHPIAPETAPDEIKPAGPGMGVVLAAVCAVAAISGGFLWITRKKK